ncbi:MAG: DUF1565 domain-containing protein [Victivallales bacterium]|nr:DUF1565 domain-containing protein [Victivallales bacterium]
MKKLLTLVICFSFAISAFGAEWYVSAATGKKKNDGHTKDAPLKAIWSALENAAAGDVIYVAQGNYRGKTSCGWILIDKPVSIIGGYSDDFSERDITKYPTMLKPTNEMNQTKPAMDVGTVGFKMYKTAIDAATLANTTTVIDGLYIDHGDANSYHAEKAKPEGVETGMYLVPPAQGSTQFPSINSAELKGITVGNLTIQNCVFLNASNYGIQLNHFQGNLKILNNVFINNRMQACEVRSTNGKADMVNFEFAYNTVLFTWSRTEEMTDMGFAVRANENTNTNIHHNFLGLSILYGFDNTKGNDKTKKVAIDNNVFYRNKKGDAAITISPSIKTFFVTDDAWEDFEDCTGIVSVEGNKSISDADIVAKFKDIIDMAYLKAFLSANYTEKIDLAELTLESKYTMFANRYPSENVLKFFGALEGVGAQAVK